MKTVHKYPFRIGDPSFSMPQDAELLCVQMQGDMPCLWALVETDNPMVTRRIKIRGTGHDCSGVGRYISTFQMAGGALVFHAFEE